MKIETLKFTCVVCGKESEQTFVHSSNNFGGRTQLDLRVVGGQKNMDLWLQECPHCHYCNTTIADKLEEADKKIIESEEYQAIVKSDINALAKKFILCAILCEKQGNKKDARLEYHYASWVFDDLNDSKNADKYRKIAAEIMIAEAYENDDADLAVQCLDLCRRNGDKENFYKLIKELEESDYEKFEDIAPIVDYERVLVAIDDRKPHFIEEASQKLSFVDFNALLLRGSNIPTEEKLKSIDRSDLTIYAPILYSLKDEYYNAVVKYLSTGKKTNLVWGEFSIEKVEQGYWVEKIDYIRAVLILNSLEQAGDDCFWIYNPYIVE